MIRSDQDLVDALASERPIVMDGAMGTGLLRRGHGIATRDWVGATLGEPGEVRAIHGSYTN